LGFISYKKKNYGIFFTAINCWTRRVFAIPIKNKKFESIFGAIEKMLKVI